MSPAVIASGHCQRGSSCRAASGTISTSAACSGFITLVLDLAVAFRPCLAGLLVAVAGFGSAWLGCDGRLRDRAGFFRCLGFGGSLTGSMRRAGGKAELALWVARRR